MLYKINYMIDNSKEYISCSAIHYDNGKHCL